MEMQEIIEFAIKNNELKECMMGAGRYNMSNKVDYSPVNETLFLNGVELIYSKGTISNIEEMVTDTICSMIEKNDFSILLAFRYIMTYVGKNKKGLYNFSLNIDVISDNMSRFIVLNEEWLKSINNINQVGYSGNLWDDFHEWNRVMEEAYGETIIKEVSEKKSKLKSIEIDSLIKKNFFAGKKIPHTMSQPVICCIESKYYLASYAIVTSKDDLSRSVTERPTLWCIADMETGKILDVYTSTEKEFSDASYDVKYSIKQEGDYDTSREYYEKAFSILDEVREEFLSSGTINKTKYNMYLDMVLRNIPKEHHRFFRDLSI